MNHTNEDIFVYAPDRPDSDKHGRITKHRLTVCENAKLFNNCLFSQIDKYFILKDGIHVHHIDGNHSNNDINNLIPITIAQHRSIHNNINITSKIYLDKIIGVIKQGELLENLEVDNQQPNLSSNTLEGSETNSQILTDSAEDSNTNTSALLNKLNMLIDDYIVQTSNITNSGYLKSISEILESEIKSSEINTL
jgi:hypothetical protein